MKEKEPKNTAGTESTESVKSAKVAAAANAEKESSKLKVLESTFAQIDKTYGKGSVMRLGQTKIGDVESISTGSIQLDMAIGVNGFPKGRVVEIYGPEATGKTTLALHTIAQAQKKGGTCAFIDAEHALDATHAKKLGVNIDELIISQPDCGEQALEIAEILIRSGAIDIVVIDSVAALVPKAEIEGEMGDSHMGLQARLMSQALRKLTPVVNKSKTVLIFINQVRQNINSVAWGNKETTTGGNALKFYASVRLDVRRIAALKKDDKHFGNRICVKVVKNKVASPFKSVELDLLFEEGVSKELDVLDCALNNNILVQSGSWISFEGENIAQGREQALKVLKNDKKIFDTICQKIRDVYNKANGAGL